ncbi:hypothetical protein K3757_04405 [Sulfitobacter sp. S223]|uniref:hypothetical protein n=1 Tax=Sulfitobacter sp. S223 TaxID=2867023 RepID=UPI0021A29303|nr:hypothetical protein [Sulfitobacter sp. S223]UWR27191.1 hypothetical protein K3757_04405 [Sulfitobacter sp. S223]
MTFAQTYREERMVNRRSRARKARIAGRIIGFGLSACLILALRTDPQLRSMVDDLVLTVIGASDEQRAAAALSGSQAAESDAIGSEEARTQESSGIMRIPATTPAADEHSVSSGVKINRGISE